MAIRLSGMNSGLDTDAIVQELVSAYNLKTEKYEKAQTKLNWKQDAWKTLNTKIYSLYTNISSLRYSSAYNLKKTSVSDTTKATVTAASGAVTGTQKLSISSLAQAGYLTGEKITGTGSKKVTSETTLSELGYSGGNSTIEIRKNDGTLEKFEVSNTTKISDVVTAFRDAGLNASFDSTNQRMFVSAKESGKDADFVLSGVDESGEQALSTLGINFALTEEIKNENGVPTGEVKFTEAGKSYEELYEYYKAAENEGKDVKEYFQELVESYNQRKSDNEKFESEIADYLVSENCEADKEYYNNLIEVKKLQDEIFTVIKDATSTIVNTEDIKSLFADIKNLFAEKYESNNGISPFTEEELGKKLGEKFGVTDEDIEKLSECLNNKCLLYNLEQLYTKSSDIPIPVENLQEAIESSDYYTNVIGKIKIIQENNEFFDTNSKIKGIAEADDEQQATLIAELSKKVNRANEVFNSETSRTGKAIKISGADAVINLNGVEYTSASNSFSINGLTIEATGTTKENEQISISTSVDSQGIYDKIKEFLTEYNNVINEMTKLYNAESAKDYEPLTDEEKDSMSETEVEKWEGKIKDALLRRDTTLNSLMSAMIISMSKSITINGKNFSLSNFGIQTMGFMKAAENEQNAYHIDGDEDDTNSSGKEDKLMKAIQEDPDQVCDFMKQLVSNLYSAIDSKMKSTTLSSAYKVYNDKEMDSQLKDYAQLIKDWEKKVSEKEEYYYKKFSAMETALSKINSQSSSLSGLLGY